MYDRYGNDVLAAASPHHRRRPESTRIPAKLGLVIEDAVSGWCGAIVRVEKRGGQIAVDLEDARGRVRSFPLGAGFLIEGKPVILEQDRPKQTQNAPLRSASGSVHLGPVKARVARASRIWVEGKHDAELVEKVWGHDLRVEGVVVELLEGADHLAECLREFQPTPTRRVGVLLDHMIQGSKEMRLAQEAMKVPGAAGNVLIIGHPFVDIWQAIKPARVGLKSWPDIPRHIDIKKGTLAALGLPHDSPAEVAAGWQQILGRVRNYQDLEPALLGRVEELIDFVTLPEA